MCFFGNVFLQCFVLAEVSTALADLQNAPEGEDGEERSGVHNQLAQTATQTPSASYKTILVLYSGPQIDTVETVSNTCFVGI